MEKYWIVTDPHTGVKTHAGVFAVKLTAEGHAESKARELGMSVSLMGVESTIAPSKTNSRSVDELIAATLKLTPMTRDSERLIHIMVAVLRGMKLQGLSRLDTTGTVFEDAPQDSQKSGVR